MTAPYDRGKTEEKKEEHSRKSLNTRQKDSLEDALVVKQGKGKEGMGEETSKKKIYNRNLPPCGLGPVSQEVPGK